MRTLVPGRPSAVAAEVLAEDDGAGNAGLSRRSDAAEQLVALYFIACRKWHVVRWVFASVCLHHLTV